MTNKAKKVTNRPNGAFLNLVQTMIREMSMGMNMPYGFLYDMSTFGGHASRIEIAQAQRGIRRFQKLLKEKALDPFRNAVLGMGISEGIIPPHPSWKNGRWGFGASLSGDYGNDIAANLQKLHGGVLQEVEHLLLLQRRSRQQQPDLTEHLLVGRGEVLEKEI